MSDEIRIVVASMDDLGWEDVDRLHRLAAAGPVTVALLSDPMVEERTGRQPRFQMDERRYIAQALRCVRDVVDVFDVASLENLRQRAEGYDWFELRSRSRPSDSPPGAADPIDWSAPGWGVAATSVARPFVAVTGCYDGLHSGHVRFFEEAAQIGSLFVTVGSDESIRGHKGRGHPHVPQDQRLGMVGAVRHVAGATIASGSGWLDAADEIEALRPDYWVVNEDGDHPEKRELCALLGIQLRVARREPKPGLPARSSTALRAEESTREID